MKSLHTNIFEKNQKKTIFFSFIIMLILTLMIFELMLRIFAPINVAFIGHRNCENGKRYGWGFSPHENLIIYDPDTGNKFSDKMNSRGWRDREHSFDNPEKIFRILALGDSVTFGAIVPMKRSYPYILQDIFSTNDMNVEVINISYGGWGTDQQLEALKNEGLKYQPDLIILQFSKNDLSDNSYFENGPKERKGWKPFYYSLDQRGDLIRRQNPFFGDYFSNKEKVVGILNTFEITKRILKAYAYFHFKNKIEKQQLIDEKTITKLLLNDLITKDSSPHQYLVNNIGEAPDLIEFEKLFRSEHNNNALKKALRILKNHPSNFFWTPEHFFPKKINTESYEWKLWQALIKRIDSTVKGIPVMVWSDVEYSRLTWERYWGSITEDRIYESEYFFINKQIKKTVTEMGWNFVEINGINRGIIDSHPNAIGNQKIAEKLFQETESMIQQK